MEHAAPLESPIAPVVFRICARDRHLLHPDVQAYCTVFGIRVLRDTESLDEPRRSTTGDEATGE